ncbi:MAG: beta-glucosidase, partial [Bacteroidetes bacterium CG_4_10_14_3_um_filter_42_6]
EANPSGKLPVTIYKSVDDLPPYEDYSMKSRTYRYFSGKALFPFGFGLSYADFNYESALTDQTVYSQGENIHLTVKLKNTSKVVGTEV